MKQISLENFKILVKETSNQSIISALDLYSFNFEVKDGVYVLTDTSESVKVPYTDAQDNEGNIFASESDFTQYLSDLVQETPNIGDSMKIGNIELLSTGSHLKTVNSVTGEESFSVQQRVDDVLGTTSVYYTEHSSQIQVEDENDAYQGLSVHTGRGSLNHENRYALPIDIQVIQDTFVHEYRSKLNTTIENLNIRIFKVTQSPDDVSKYNTLSGLDIVEGWYISKKPYWELNSAYRIDSNSNVNIASGDAALPFSKGFSLASGDYYRFVISGDNDFEFQGVSGAPNPFGGTQFIPYIERSYTGEVEVKIKTEGASIYTTALDFYRDGTNTTIILSNGESYPVNTIKAVEENGTIKLISVDDNADITFIKQINHELVSIAGTLIGGSVTNVVNQLNQLFAVQPLGLGGDYISTLPTLEGVDITANFAEGQDPLGDSIYGVGSDASQHGARIWSDETIDEVGEFYEVKITGKGQFMLGLYDANSNDLTEIANNSGNGHSGYLWANAFYNYGSYVAPWTYYGSNSSSSIQEGWTGSQDRQFRYNTIIQDNLANANPANPVLFKVGINAQGYISVWYFDEGRSNEYIMTARSSYTLPEGQYGLLVKLVNGTVQLVETPKRTATDPTAPALTYRYIESPDGNFEYPLFATQEEADYVDTQNGGSGTSHTHVYEDDATQTVWWMPDTGSEMSGTSAPSNTSEITYNEIPTQEDSLFVPTAFADQTITVNEGEAVNLQLHPTGNTGFTTTIGGIPEFTLVNGYLQGNAPEVTGDNVANPSDTTTVTVYRTNSFGTSQGTLTIVINNSTPPTVDVTGITHEGDATLTGSVANANTWFSIDETLSAGERLILSSAFLEDVLSEMNNLDEVIIGLKSNSWSNTDNASAYGDEDSTGIIENFKIRLYKNQNGAKFAQITHNNNTVALGSPMFTGTINNYNLFLEITDSGNNIRSGWSYGSNSYTDVTTLTYGNFPTSNANKAQTGDQGLGITDVDIMVYWNRSATTAGDFDYNNIDWTALTEQDIPVASTNLTSWTKALDFSGSSERAQQVGASTNYMPIGMDGLSATVTAPSTSGNTSGHIYSRPWAVAIVFKADGNNSNQHIWNQGEGAGSTDDNIYLRIDSNGQIYFGWGRTGGLNECALGSTTIGKWYGVYVAHNGTRLSGSNATAANLADAFDIRITTEVGNWTGATFNYSQSYTWSTNGGRMDRSVTGNFTVGGRGANRNFHGKVASMVVTTLRINQPMPDTTEIEMMITDPMKWLQDYKVGNLYRRADSQAETTFQLYNYLSNAIFATQVWLMGDGTLDNYSNMIRNQVYPNDQNYTKLNMISMASNDIETVNINGLT